MITVLLIIHGVIAVFHRSDHASFQRVLAAPSGAKQIFARARGVNSKGYVNTIIFSM
jgi:hypothetical protein